MLLVKKCNFFHFLFSVKMRLEIRFNNVLERKTLFNYKGKLFQSPKHRTFPMWLTHGLVKKTQYFLYLFSVKIRPQIRFTNVLDREKLFLTIKTKFFNVSKIVFFQRG